MVDLEKKGIVGLDRKHCGCQEQAAWLFWVLIGAKESCTCARGNWEKAEKYFLGEMGMAEVEMEDVYGKV